VAEEQSTDNTSKSVPIRPRCVNCIVSSAKLICGPKAIYPELARMAHVFGEVRYFAVIGTDGRVASLRLQSGHYLLVRAAMDAAKRYRYKPAIARMGGLIPVEEVLLITVEVKPDDPQLQDHTGCDALSETGEHH
jgi:TonB family protein